MIKRIVHHQYGGETAVTLSFAQYRAMLLPEIGANLISFRDVERGLHFLRTPPARDMQQLKHNSPYVYGIPVLFPPNRVEDGTFTFQHHRYQFPINEPNTHNHLHGLLHSVPWRVVDTGTLPEQVYVDVAQTVGAQHPVYRYFPHPFTFVIRYALSVEGLRQTVHVRNTGPQAMPFMLGFHTTLNVPFASESDGADYTFTATIGKRWELNERRLPTGLQQTLSVQERELRSAGVSPFIEAMDNHYTAEAENGRNYVTLTDHRLGTRLVYDAGLRYKTWMIYNHSGEGNYICPEPQTSVVNAPNTGLTDETSGFITLGPGQTWSETSSFYVETLCPGFERYNLR